MSVNTNAYGETPYASLFPTPPTNESKKTTENSQEAAARRALAQKILTTAILIFRILATVFAIGMLAAGITLTIVLGNPIYVVGAIVTCVLPLIVYYSKLALNKVVEAKLSKI